MMRHLSLFLTKNKSLLILLIIVLIPIVILSYFLLFQDFKSREEQETQKNLQMAQMLEQSLDTFIKHTRSSLEGIGTLSTISHGNREEIEQLLYTLSKAENEVSLFWITNAQGQIIAKYPNVDSNNNVIPDRTALGKEFFAKAMQGKPTVSDNLTGEMTNREIIIISVPYYNNQGTVAGVIGASIPLENIQKKLTIKVGASGYPILVSKSGKFLAHPKLKDIRQKVRDGDPVWKALRAGGSGTFELVAPYDGVRKFFSYVPLTQADWMVIVIQPLNEFESQLHELFTRNAFIIFLVILLIGLAARYLVLTRNREEEARVARSEKLAVVGELAAGMAHEIRNPLTAISGFIQMIMQREDGRAPHEYLETIMLEINQIQRIIEETLVLAKPAPVQIIPVDVSQVIKDVFTLMKPTANMRHCTLNLDCAANLPLIQAEPNRLKQAFVNLVKNSIESLPESGGKVSVDINAAGDKLLISVKDTGSGMPRELIEKLGSPFLTTKQTGTGLGLTVTFRIIQNHGGTIRIESSLGVGTSIFITLPLAPVNDVIF